MLLCSGAPFGTVENLSKTIGLRFFFGHQNGSSLFFVLLLRGFFKHRCVFGAVSSKSDIIHVLLFNFWCCPWNTGFRWAFLSCLARKALVLQPLLEVDDCLYFHLNSASPFMNMGSSILLELLGRLCCDLYLCFMFSVSPRSDILSRIVVVQEILSSRPCNMWAQEENHFTQLGLVWESYFPVPFVSHLDSN